MMQEFPPADLELFQRVSAWNGPSQLRALTADELARISRSQGVDFATALLYQAIRSHPDSLGVFESVTSILQSEMPNHSSLDAVFVVAPGAFYREYPATGADGKRLCGVAERMGCRSYVIPTESAGGVAVNGHAICEWLLRRQADVNSERIILCSLSKGGADVKTALANPTADHAFRNVVAWLNVGGITGGSPMATWLLDRPLLAAFYRAICWWRGKDFGFVRELARQSGSLLDFVLEIPSHIRAVHVVGFPLKRHVQPRKSCRWHRRLSQYGPNDGAALLADSCALPGIVFPVWGADHYFDTSYHPEQLLEALLIHLASELELIAGSKPRHCLARSPA
jgi:hypothetical protein